MTSRFDIVIFGATGFTGKHAVEETIRLAKKDPFTWAVAGRSQKKLEELLAEIGNKTGENLSNIKTIIADVKDEQSLKEMALQARVLANCCGPYRHYGEPVVKACIEAKTHHVDVCGEPQFIETMQLKYDQAAKDAGVYIISSCGFDSIPNDMGVVFLKQNFGGTLNSVESYISSKIPPEYAREAFSSGSIHYGTWESLVYSLANSKELGPLRKKLYSQRMPTFKPKLLPRSVLHRRNSAWCIPFPGADNSIVYRTQRFFYEETNERPVQFKAYFKIGGLFYSFMIILAAVLFYLLSLNSFTRNLLLKYPKLFSLGMITHEGPKEEVMNNTKFQMELYGEGWESGSDVDSTPPNKKVVARVRGVNPGYGATVTALMVSALVVLRESNNMPKPGGVLTTGAAFSKTDLIKILNENNLTFEIVNKK